MNLLLLLFLSLALASCGGGGGGGDAGSPEVIVANFVTEYIYPDNTLTPGQGTIEVAPIGVKCLENNKEVALENCTEAITDFSVAPKQNQKSPAGPGVVRVNNSLEEEVPVVFVEGQSWHTMSNEDKVSVVQGLVTCQVGFDLAYTADCIQRESIYLYGQYPANELLACAGSQTVTRTVSCISNISGEVVDQDECSHHTVEDLSTTYQSPEGEILTTLSSGDQVNLLCGVGMTLEDLGTGSSISSYHSCGANRHIEAGVCTNDTFTAISFNFEELDLNPGDGVRLANAESVNECQRDHSGEIAPSELCTIPFPVPTQEQLSPAGQMNVTVPNAVSQASVYIEEGLTWDDVEETVKSQRIANSGVECVTGLALSYTGQCLAQVISPIPGDFPVNDLLACQGTREVSRSHSCFDNISGGSLDSTHCTYTGETQTQLSPAGEAIDVPLSHNDKGVVLCDEGKTVADLGNGATVIRHTECGIDRFLDHSSMCQNETYVIGSFEFIEPNPTLEVGDGEVEVTATNILECLKGSNGELVDINKCSMPSEPPKFIFKSPAGTKEISNVENDLLTYVLAEGELFTSATPINSITCAQGRTHISSTECDYNQYEALGFIFPEISMVTGEGERTVDATGIATCRENISGQNVNPSLCAMPIPAPTQTYQSPAGTITNTNFYGDTATYFLALGEEFTEERVPDELVCGTARVRSGNECQGQNFIASDFTFPVNDMLAGDGSRVITADGFNLCLGEADGQYYDINLCSMPSLPPTQEQFSPAGEKHVNNENGDLLIYTLAEGELFNTGMTPSSRVCGTGRVDNGTTCEEQSYIASDFNYPENNMNAGDGTLVVSAISFNLCTGSVDHSGYDLSKCDMPTPAPTQTQLSPAGDKVVNNDFGDVLIYSLGEGVLYTEGMPESSRTCGTLRIDNGTSCQNEELVASGFIFPENTLAPGDGAVNVSATSFSTCTAQSSGASVDVGLCVAPNPMPAETYYSPSGVKEITNEYGDRMTYSYGYGEAHNETKYPSSGICRNSSYYFNGESICQLSTFTADGFIFPENNLGPGDGYREVEATGFTTCVNDQTGARLEEPELCLMPESIPTVSYYSPAGIREVINEFGDTFTYSYSYGEAHFEGKYADSAICRSNIYHFDGHTCTLMSFTAYDFTYPENDMVAGEGSKIVFANNFERCLSDNNGGEYPLDNCALPFPLPEIYQYSPAGFSDFTNSEGDILTGRYDEGATYPSEIIAVVSCGEDRTVQWDTSWNTCYPNNYVAYSFEYPVNDLDYGQGTREVSPIGVAECRNDYTLDGLEMSELAPSIKCVIPLDAPMITQHSPLNNNFTVEEDGNVYQYKLKEGELFDFRSSDLIGYTCVSGLNLLGGKCRLPVAEPYKAKHVVSYKDGVIYWENGPLHLFTHDPYNSPYDSNYVQLTEDLKQVILGEGIKQIKASATAFVVLTLEGNIYTWGDIRGGGDARGEHLYDGNEHSFTIASSVLGEEEVKFKEVFGSGFNGTSLNVLGALTTDDRLIVWGNETYDIHYKVFNNVDQVVWGESLFAVKTKDNKVVPGRPMANNPRLSLIEDVEEIFVGQRSIGALYADETNPACLRIAFDMSAHSSYNYETYETGYCFEKGKVKVVNNHLFAIDTNKKLHVFDNNCENNQLDVNYILDPASPLGFARNGVVDIIAGRYSTCNFATIREDGLAYYGYGAPGSIQDQLMFGEGIYDFEGTPRGFDPNKVALTSRGIFELNDGYLSGMDYIYAGNNQNAELLTMYDGSYSAINQSDSSQDGLLVVLNDGYFFSTGGQAVLNLPHLNDSYRSTSIESFLQTGHYTAFMQTNGTIVVPYLVGWGDFTIENRMTFTEATDYFSLYVGYALIIVYKADGSVEIDVGGGRPRLNFENPF